MSVQLERRYGRLLRLYPSAYRRERGDEVLTTLLETAEPGTVRPTARETLALVLGALRAHAGTNVRLTPGQTWMSAVRTGALMLLAYATAYTLVDVAEEIRFLGTGEFGVIRLLHPDSLYFVALALQVTAIVAVVRARYRTALVATVPAYLLAQAIDPFGVAQVGAGEFWQLPLVVVLLVPLLRHRGAAPLGPLAVAVVPPVTFVAVEYFYGHSLTIQLAVIVAVCLAYLAWGAVDQRIPLALGLLLLTGVLDQAGAYVQGQPGGPGEIVLNMALAAVLPGVLVGAGAMAARRQARL